MKIDMKIPENVKNIMQTLNDSRFEAYIIGGAVRDFFLGVEPHDFDIFTNATGEDILELFPNGKVLGGEERQAKILTVIVDGVEISQYRSNGDRTETGNSLEQHQKTCDFTLNAIAVEINGVLVGGDNDLSSVGMEDLYSKQLICVGKPEDRIGEDKLRIFRAIRFAAKYDLDIDKKLGILIFNTNFDSLPKERVRDELLKIMSINKGYRLLFKYGLLEKINPLYSKLRGMPGGDFHDESVMEHLFNANEMAIQTTDNKLLIFAASVHDLGKALTFTKEVREAELIEASLTPNGNYCSFNVDYEIHFYQHEKKGAEYMEDWMREYKFSESDIKYVGGMIRLHMFSYKEDPSKKSYLKFFAKLEEAGIPIEHYIMQLYCDHQGNEAKPRIKFGDFVESNWLLKKYWEAKFSKEPFTVKDLEVGGKDLIALGMTPGPKFREFLADVLEKVMDGELKNERSELLNYVKNTYGE